MREDPLGLAGGDVNTLRYAGNAVTIYSDPSGLSFGGWWARNNMDVRAGGVARAVGGFAVASFGVTFGTVTSPTVGGGVAGSAVAAWGTDVAGHGLADAFTGTHHPTWAAQAFDRATGTNEGTQVEDGVMAAVAVAQAARMAPTAWQNLQDLWRRNAGRAKPCPPKAPAANEARQTLPGAPGAGAAPQVQTTRGYTATEGMPNLNRPGTGATGPGGLPTSPGAGGTFVTPTAPTNPAALELHMQRSLPGGAQPKYVAEIEVPTAGWRADPTGDLRFGHGWVAPDTPGARIVRLWEVRWVDHPGGYPVPTIVEVPVPVGGR